MELTFSQYLTRVAISKERFPNWRMGQTYFNVLQSTDAEFAQGIAGKPEDPFYRDDAIGNFLSHIYVVGDWAK